MRAMSLMWFRNAILKWSEAKLYEEVVAQIAYVYDLKIAGELSNIVPADPEEERN